MFGNATLVLSRPEAPAQQIRVLVPRPWDGPIYLEREWNAEIKISAWRLEDGVLKYNGWPNPLQWPSQTRVELIYDSG